MCAAALSGFENLVGAHCSSSAVRSVLAYDGLDVAESVVFGLGSGLGFFYRHEDERSPSRRFNGRAPDLEGTFYRRAGAPIAWEGSWRPERIRAALTSGRPMLAQTDIHSIPYYDDVHFIGHGLAVIGVEGDRLEVADIAAADFSHMTLAAFRAAVATDHPPLLAPYRYGVAPVVEQIDVESIAPAAIGQTAAYMLRPPSAEEGLPAMRSLAAELPSWTELADAGWACRFGYQSIEKRGTGGGNFRFLYAEFLDRLAERGLEVEGADAFQASGTAWSEAADHLKTAAFASGAPELSTSLELAGAAVAVAADIEAEVFERLDRRFNA